MLGNGNGFVGFRSMVLLGWMTAAFGIGTANAQDFIYHDDFNDGDVSGATDGGHWVLPDEFSSPGSTMDASSGDLVFNSERGFMLAHLESFNGVPVPERTEWSVRARMTVHNSVFTAVGTRALNHAALTSNGRLQVGTNFDRVFAPLPYPFFDEEVLIQMDAFDGEVKGTVWKDGDLASPVEISKSYTPELTLPAFGVGGSGLPGNATIHEAWISMTPIPIVIPEPSTLALVGLCLAALLGLRQRLT